jgi:LDH2 family malate/lactate/ureidoglycolate dehydrogenase
MLRLWPFVTNPLAVHSALWHEVEALAEQGLVGIAVLNSKSFVVHHGAKSGTEDDMVYGTNPMAFAFPRPDGLPPLLWDQVRTCLRFLTRARIYCRWYSASAA